MRKLIRLLIDFAKFLFFNIPFLRGIEISLRFKRSYKRNFGNIKFQGQFFQDMIAFMFLKNRKGGFYVDIGASTGVRGSNTFIFEQIGWNGFCVEPLPNVFRTLIKYRKCDCYNVALSSESNENVEFLMAKSNTLSGIYGNMSESHKQRIKESGEGEIIRVKTMTFDDIMANYPNIKHIDFMSLDVEGHEIPILETINFNKYSFGFLTIEKNEPEKIMDIMNKNGYKYFMDVGGDLMFIPK